jgi:hypothetical protein
MSYLNSAVPYRILNFAGKNSAAPHFYGKFSFLSFGLKIHFLIYSSIYINISINLYNYLYDIYHLFYVNRNSIIISIKIELFL